MAEAERDQNRVTTLLAVDSSDGLTPLKAEITAATGRLRVDSVASAGDEILGQVKITDGTEVVNVNTDNQFEVAPHGQYDRYAQDASTEAIDVIQYEHHEIHSGSHYYLEGHATLGSAGVLRVKLVTPDTAKWAHFVWSISSSLGLTTDFYEGASGGMADGARASIHANNRNTNCWSGSHTGGDDVAILTDSTQAWTVDALIGLQVFNQTDGSSAFITDNDATTATGVLSGGTGNDWDTNDVYEINNSQLVVTSGVTAATTPGLLVSDSGWSSRSAGATDRDDEIILKSNTTYYRTFTSGAASNVVSFKASWYEHTDKN